MVPQDKLCLFKKGCSGEIPLKWEGEACQKLWNLSQALRRFPAVGVKHTIHLICILFQVSCCSAEGEAAAGSCGAHCSRTQGMSVCGSALLLQCSLSRTCRDLWGHGNEVSQPFFG